MKNETIKEPINQILNNLQVNDDDVYEHFIPVSSESLSEYENIKYYKRVFLNNLRAIEPDFVFNPELTTIYHNVFNYFFNPEFKTYNENSNTISASGGTIYDAKKGLLICGGVGSGKTLLFKIVNMTLNKLVNSQHFVIVSVTELQKKYQLKGYAGILRYLENTITNNYNVENDSPLNLMIDDLGIESDTSSFFGNNINLMNNILLNRYELFKEFGVKTHATTNLNIDMIKSKYDERVISRLSEMFNIIILNNKDYRKTK